MKGKFIWQSPSNIAIVKYWGKYGDQLPMNPSLSFTLKNSYTETALEYDLVENSNEENIFLFDGEPNVAFGEKIWKFFDKVQHEFPVVRHFRFKINSKNTFPHSTGIASSASAMSALALCLVSLEEVWRNEKLNSKDFLQRASTLARLGSGSACRSVFPLVALWGKHDNIPNTAQEYAVGWKEHVHTAFSDICDTILIVNKLEKKVSSSAGHALMQNHPFRETRKIQANENLLLLTEILTCGDWNKFITVCEEEALSLHGLMMSSRPGYVLLEPDSIKIIQQIRACREETKLPICFTIDAGPNIHILYPKEIESKIREWLYATFENYFIENKIIFDYSGNGPIQL